MGNLWHVLSVQSWAFALPQEAAEVDKNHKLLLTDGETKALQTRKDLCKLAWPCHQNPDSLLPIPGAPAATSPWEKDSILGHLPVHD